LDKYEIDLTQYPTDSTARNKCWSIKGIQIEFQEQ
jgi:hypothetical protein